MEISEIAGEQKTINTDSIVYRQDLYPIFKTCTVCKNNLPFESFDKYRYQFKECRREYKKEK